MSRVAPSEARQSELPVRIHSAPPSRHELSVPFVYTAGLKADFIEQFVERVSSVIGLCTRSASDALPSADVLVLGNVLHDSNMDERLLLLKKTRESLRPGGALIVYEDLIDDARTNVMALMASLNMLVETLGGSNFTAADCTRWMRDAGFRSTGVKRLTGTISMIIGIR